MSATSEKFDTIIGRTTIIQGTLILVDSVRIDGKVLGNIEDFKANDIALCKENSAVLAVKNNPIHLTDFIVKENELWIKGHSLMSGYLEEELMSFKDNYLIINNL